AWGSWSRSTRASCGGSAGASGGRSRRRGDAQEPPVADGFRVQLLEKGLDAIELVADLASELVVDRDRLAQDLLPAGLVDAGAVLLAELLQAPLGQDDPPDRLEVEAHELLELADASYAGDVLLRVANRPGRHADPLGDLSDSIGLAGHLAINSSGSSSSRPEEMPAAWPASACTNRDPRSHEAQAATRHITSEATNAMCSPWMNGPEISLGKKVVPVR